MSKAKVCCEIDDDDGLFIWGAFIARFDEIFVLKAGTASKTNEEWREVIVCERSYIQQCCETLYGGNNYYGGPGVTKT